MRLLSAVSIAIVGGWLCAGVVMAQTSTERPSHIPTPQPKDSPFGTEWAKPPGTTGSHIYNDPRRYDPQDPSVTRSRCPAPSIYDPTAGRCK